MSYLLRVASYLISIIIAISFWTIINKRIDSKQEFSGLAWGITCAALGFGGIIGVIIFIFLYRSINKKVKLLEVIEEKKKTKKQDKDEKLEPYVIYARRQLKDCRKAYIICFTIIFIICLAIRFNVR